MSIQQMRAALDDAQTCLVRADKQITATKTQINKSRLLAGNANVPRVVSKAIYGNGLDPKLDHIREDISKLIKEFDELLGAIDRNDL